MPETLPLEIFWKSKGAREEVFDGVIKPAWFISPEKDYEIATAAAGLFDFSDRGKIKVTGEDRIEVLNRLLTQDIKSLKTGQGCHSAFLTGLGKIIATMRLYVFEEFVLIDTDAALQAKLMERLEKLIILEDIQLQDVTESYAHFGLLGKKVDEALRSLSIIPGKQFRQEAIDLKNLTLILLTYPYKEEFFCEILTETEIAEKCAGHLLEHGFKPVGFEAYEAVRIKSGFLKYGQDIDETITLPEAQLDHIMASETKGCYPGQEVVAKTNTYKGHTKKCICLRLEEKKKAGEKIYIEDKEAGWITSGNQLNNYYIGYKLKEFFNSGSK